MFEHILSVKSLSLLIHNTDIIYFFALVILSWVSGQHAKETVS